MFLFQTPILCFFKNNAGAWRTINRKLTSAIDRIYTLDIVPMEDLHTGYPQFKEYTIVSCSDLINHI